MADVAGALLGWEEVEQGSDFAPSLFYGARVGFSKQRLKLGEHHFDGVQVGAVRWQEKEMSAGGPDCSANARIFVTSEIVEHDDIARLEVGYETLLDPCGEGCRIDRTIEDAGRHDLVLTQGSHERQGLPMSVGNLGHQCRTPQNQPRNRVMLVLIQVSSKKTRRSAEIRC